MIHRDNQYLYRGINTEMFLLAEGRLIPSGQHQNAPLYPSEHLFPSERLFPGNHHRNAIDKHQNPLRFDEDGFKSQSAYVSTTPHFEKALNYATSGNKVPGYVFVIDRAKLALHKTEEFIVAEIATHITEPEDEEVLLKPNPPGSAIPEQVIVEIRKVEPTEE